MLRKSLPLLLLCAAPVLFAVVPQKRASKKEVVAFPVRIANSTKAWEAKRYGTCIAELKEALTLCRNEQRVVILKALPPAPAGWSIKPQDKKANEQAAAAMAMLGGMAGAAPIEQVYTEDDGKGYMKVSVVVNSPMVKMMGMMFSNPAMLDGKQELIEYESCKAILGKKGNGAELQILIAGNSLATGTVRNHDDEFLLKQFNQAVVDAMTTAISQ